MTSPEKQKRQFTVLVLVMLLITVIFYVVSGLGLLALSKEYFWAALTLFGISLVISTLKWGISELRSGIREVRRRMSK